MRGSIELIAGLFFATVVLIGPISLVLYLEGRKGSRWERLGFAGIFASASTGITSLLISHFERRFQQLLDYCIRIIKAALGEVGLASLSAAFAGVIEVALGISLVLSATCLSAWLGWVLAPRRKDDEPFEQQATATALVSASPREPQRMK